MLKNKVEYSGSVILYSLNWCEASLYNTTATCSGATFVLSYKKTY